MRGVAREESMIPQWSYSRLGCYERCPKQAEFKFIKKIKEPQHPAMERGKNIHQLCCLLYTSPSPRDGLLSRMPSSA